MDGTHARHTHDKERPRNMPRNSSRTFTSRSVTVTSFATMGAGAGDRKNEKQRVLSYLHTHSVMRVFVPGDDDDDGVTHQ